MRNNRLHENERIYTITNSYLAGALSYLGHHYHKDGFGKDTVYTFIDSKMLKESIDGINQLKIKR